MGAGKGEMRDLCKQVLDAGNDILKTGYNVKIGCENRYYQKLVESGMSEQKALNRCTHSDDDRLSKRAEMYGICEDIIRMAKKICAAGYNARFGCLNNEFEAVVEEMEVL